MINENGERELVSIRPIDAVTKHPNADSLDLVMVGGWQVVAKLGEFQPGDLCLYFEVDAVLPEVPPFEFLRKSCFVDREWIRGFRLKTIRLRGELSQGLVVPTSVLTELGLTLEQEAAITNGEGSLTEILGVKKWEPPVAANLRGLAKGSFPSWIPKTDQERIQNLSKALGTWAKATIKSGASWEVTEKLDGSSMTCFATRPVNGEGAKIGVCSRNLELTETEENTFWQVARREKILEKLYVESFETGEGIAIQGELVGPGIQGNKYGLTVPQLYVFDVYLIDQRRYMTPVERREFIARLGLQHVPVIEEKSFIKRIAKYWSYTEYTLMQGILLGADGPSHLNHSAVREGLVFKMNDPSKSTGANFANRIQHTSFKAISNVWLLGNKE